MSFSKISGVIYFFPILSFSFTVNTAIFPLSFFYPLLLITFIISPCFFFWFFFFFFRLAFHFILLFYVLSPSLNIHQLFSFIHTCLLFACVYLILVLFLLVSRTRPYFSFNWGGSVLERIANPSQVWHKVNLLHFSTSAHSVLLQLEWALV